MVAARQAWAVCYRFVKGLLDAIVSLRVNEGEKVLYKLFCLGRDKGHVVG